MILKHSCLDVDVTKRTFYASVDFTRWKNHTSAKGQCPGPGKFADLFGPSGKTILTDLDRLEIPTLMVQVSSNPNYVQLPPRKSFFIAHAIANSSDPEALAKVVCASGLSIDSIIVGRLLGISETLPAKLSEKTEKIVLKLSETSHFMVDEAVSGKVLGCVRALLGSYYHEEVLLGSLVVSGIIPRSRVLVRKEIIERLDSIQSEFYKPYYEPIIPKTKDGNDDFNQPLPNVSRQIFLGGVVTATLK